MAGHRAETTGEGRRLPVWLLPGLIVLASAAHSLQRAFLIDDAFISFRYAHNLVDGHGLVYNLGERVEGYTNFLWTLLVAAALRLDLDPGAAARTMGILASCVLLVVIHRWAIRLGLGPWWSLVAPAMLAVDRSYAAWATGGLETRLFTLLIVAAASSFGTEKRPWSALLLGTAALTRPEGAIAILAGLLCLVHRVARSREDRELRRHAIWWTAIALLPPLLHLGWRLVYYGEWLPNSFHAKVPGLRLLSGGVYVGLFAWHHVVPVAAVLLAALLISPREFSSRMGRGPARMGRLPLLFLAGYILYTLAVGGDHFEFRFMDPVLPFLYLIPPLVLGPDPRRAGEARPAAARGALGAVGAVLLVVAAGSSTFRGFQDFDRNVGASGAEQYVSIVSVETESGYLERWERIGLWLREHAGSGESIAVLAAGAIPYRSRLRALDMLGINDREIARLPVRPGRNVGHERGVDAAYASGRGLTYLVDGMAVRRERVEILPAGSVEVDFGDFCWYFWPLQPGSKIRPGERLRTPASPPAPPGPPT